MWPKEYLSCCWIDVITNWSYNYTCQICYTYSNDVSAALQSELYVIVQNPTQNNYGCFRNTWTLVLRYLRSQIWEKSSWRLVVEQCLFSKPALRQLLSRILMNSSVCTLIPHEYYKGISHLRQTTMILSNWVLMYFYDFCKRVYSIHLTIKNG